MSLEYHHRHHDRFLPAAIEDRLIGLFARAAGLAMLVLVAISWLAILTWSSQDPSLMHATGGATRNVFGYFGATISDLLLQTFGLASALLLLAPMFWGLEMLLSERIKAFGSKATYFPLAILILAGALSSLPMVSGWPLHHGYGGILGDAVYRLGSSLMTIAAPERAGALTGLIFFALGSAALAYSVGIELKDITALVKSRATQFATWPRHEPSLQQPEEPTLVEPLEPAMAPPQSNNEHALSRWAGTLSPMTAISAWWQKVPKRDEQPERQPDHAHAAPASYDFSHDAQAPTAQSHFPPRNEPAPAPNSATHHARAPAQPHPGARQYLNQIHPGYQSRPQAPGHPAHQQQVPPAAPWQPAAQSPARPIAHAPMPTRTQAGRHNQTAPAYAPNVPPSPPMNRGHDFDGATDDASRSIAQRFAPASSQNMANTPPAPGAHAPQRPAPANTRAAMPQPVQRQPGKAVPAAQKSQAFLKGQPPLKSQPVLKDQPPLKGQPLLRGMKFSASPPKYQRPSLNLLARSSAKKPAAHVAKTVLRGNAQLLEEVLADFGVKGEIRAIKPGPLVTLFELEPARGTKSSRVIGLADDIARSMSAKSARVSVIQGRNAIGIELPNARTQPVILREVLESESFRNFAGTLPIALGKSITGDPVIADLARMPHLLIAGTTGSGKSVGVNAIITSLLYRFAPDQCRLVMIDPKMLELSVYNGIPHLLTPVVTDPQKAVAALNWVVGEMEERYKRMSKMAVRNIDIYNNRVRNAKKRGDMIARTVQTGFDRATGQAVYEQQQMAMEPMPYIVVVIDEFADLMVTAGKEIEAAVQRLSQMARAAGIHLIMATQRPSVDVITGTIKSNFPTRISYKVASKVDSRTILGEQGAEQLLGNGDMLYAAGAGNALRVHGPFLADDEVENIVAFLRERYQPDYVEGVTDLPDDADESNPTIVAKPTRSKKSTDDAELYERAVALVLRDGKATTSYLQRRLSIGYNRAADLIERMEQQNIVSPAGPTGKRKIIANKPGGTADA